MLLLNFHMLNSGVAEFMEESTRLVESIDADGGTDAEVKRWLHTLKGNSGPTPLSDRRRRTRPRCLEPIG